MLRLVSIFFITLFAFTAAGQNFSAKEVDKVLDLLDKDLDNRDFYISNHQAEIDSIKQRMKGLESSDELLRLQLEVANKYRSFNNDSAYHYYKNGSDMAAMLGNKRILPLFEMGRAVCLPLGGLVDQAIEIYKGIDRSQLNDSSLIEYYSAGRQMYSYITSFYNDYATIHNEYQAMERCYRDSLLSHLEPGTPRYMLNLGEKLLDEGSYVEAKSSLLSSVEGLTSDSNLYARINHKLATIARIDGDTLGVQYYLALSAMADLKGAVLEVMALQELGAEMSSIGDIDRAYRYLSTALSNAVDCSATLRIVQSSSALPLIIEAHQKQEMRWKNHIFLFMTVLAVALVVLTIVLIALRNQMKKQHSLQRRLSEANNVKEIYISQFLRLCSIYIDRLNQFGQIANRKISAGKVEDFFKMIQSGKFVEEQSEQFYKLFDDAFLHIYPNFVDEVNRLLRDKIVLKEGELLNNELRILAFMRLGLDDTNQVALILNYSVNTIYAYRNKIRNKAYDRDNFERNIMRIGEISLT